LISPVSPPPELPLLGTADVCFSIRETYEYRAEPIKTTKIPIPFMVVIGVAKIIVEMAIIRTCFTFAAMLGKRTKVMELVVS
jgi:hypothetical protein